MGNKLGVLFVCTANICRSPMAEAVLRHKAAAAGLDVEVDSAATHDFRIGEAPDSRARLAVEQRGYTMPARKARQITRDDLENSDYVLAMDIKNMTALHQLAGGELWQKPKLLLPYSRSYGDREIADPYGMGAAEFDAVLDRIESAVDGLLGAMRRSSQA